MDTLFKGGNIGLGEKIITEVVVTKVFASQLQHRTLVAIFMGNPTALVSATLMEFQGVVPRELLGAMCWPTVGGRHALSRKFHYLFCLNLS